MAHQPTCFDIFAKGIDRGHRVTRRQRDKLSAAPVEQRIGANQYNANRLLRRLTELAADLVSLRVAVIATVAGTSAALAAKAATTTTPIVFTTGSDPVQIGLVASLNRPGGNVTGINAMQVEAQEKRFALVHELLPATTRFAVIVNPNNQMTDSLIAQTRARRLRP